MKVLVLILVCVLCPISGHCFEIGNVFHKKHMHVIKKKKLKITAYTNSRKENGRYSLTANNKKLKKGYIAVSRDLLKNGWDFGKKVYIEELGVFEIQDTMHARMKNSLDIFMLDKNKAEEFGVKKLEVHLLTAENSF